MQCCALSHEIKNRNKVKITVTYDMGLQKRLFVRIYESSIWHALIIGGISNGISGYGLYSKALKKCNAADKRGEESEYH